MKDQVTTIEQSRRLIELGVPADKTSMVWFGDNDDMLAPREAANDLTMYNQREYLKDTIRYPSYTVADLLELIPLLLCIKDTPHIHLLKYYEDGWSMGYDLTEGHKLIDTIFNRIEWFLSNGYKLEV